MVKAKAPKRYTLLIDAEFQQDIDKLAKLLKTGGVNADTFRSAVRRLSHLASFAPDGRLMVVDPKTQEKLVVLLN